MNAADRNQPQGRGTGSRSFAVGLLAGLLCWGQAMPAWAAPAQVPLLTRTQASVQPNVVFTFDDSGSMAWRFMPDAVAAPGTSTGPSVVRGGCPTSGTASANAVWSANCRWLLTFHPADQATFGTGVLGEPRLVATRPNTRTSNNALCETDDQFSDCRASDLASARMRSTAYNTIYYDPEIRYQPWYNADGSQLPNADIRAAWLDPTNRTAVGTVAERNTAVSNGTAARLVTENSSGTIISGEVTISSTSTTPLWCRSATGNTPNTTPSSQRNNTQAYCSPITTAGVGNPFTYTQANCLALGNSSFTSGSNGYCQLTNHTTQAACTAATGNSSNWTSNQCRVNATRWATQTFCESTRVGKVWFDGACYDATANESFTPAVYYHYHGGSMDLASNFSRVRLNELPATGIVRGASRTDCAASGSQRLCTRAQELQNFANWFTYYRTRNYTAIAASTKAFAEQGEDIRVGYGRINKGSTSIDGVATATLERGVRTFAGADRVDFFSWLHTVPASGGTPLRRAMDDIGRYYQRQDNRGPWGNTPGTNDGSATDSHLQCRKSYHLLTTDGYWNGAPAVQATGNVDNVNGPNITGPTGNSYQYTPARPYRDTHSDTLADVAMYYWNRDLRPDLPNRVPPDSKNPAFWQHMVNFTVSLGLTGTLTYPDALAGLEAGTINWPAPGNDKLENLDDLWHAAVNSRGEFLSTQKPDEFANALSSFLQEIVVRNASEGGVAAAAATLQAGNRKYVPEYKTAVWSGDVKAYVLDAFGQQGQLQWSAEQRLPAHGDRNILLGTRNATPRAVPFRWTDLSTALREELGTGSSEALVDFLRGSDALEGGLFRDRQGVLGDFVNSQPIFVQGLVDMQYHLLPATAGGSSYRSFVASKKARDGVIFIGGNDGMLHAFRDVDGGTPATRSGREIFAFIPRILLSGLSALASPSYGHRYYVDGQLTESDAYWGGSWKNVIVGATGAGARAVFALDVTNMTSMGASNVLWELDSTMDNDLGYVLAPIEVGRMKNGDWAAVFGNGYYGATGAKLFIVNLQTGAVIKKISVPGGNTNGMGGARVIRNANREIVGAYAGDLQGKLWKFDLSASNTALWDVAFSGQPLYNAGASRPITAPPQYVQHPEGGFMVLVGTGKLHDEGDQSNATGQAIYGLWDQQKLQESGGNWSWSADATPITVDSSIVAQSIDVQTISGAGGTTFYTITSQPLNWSIHRGWSMNLSIAVGQRNLLSPQLIFGFALFETMSPATGGIINPCDNSSAGASYNLLINPLNGAMPGTPVFDTTGDGVVNPDGPAQGGDQIVGGVGGVWDGRDVVLTQRPCLTAEDCPQVDRCPAGTKFISIQGSISGSMSLCLPVPPPSRWWWRELPG